MTSTTAPFRTWNYCTAPRLDAYASCLRTALLAVRQVGTPDLVLVGSAPMAALSLRDVRDLDVLVSEDLFAKLSGYFQQAYGEAYEAHDGQAFAVAVPDLGTIEVATDYKRFADVGLATSDVFERALAPGATRVGLDFRVMALYHMELVKRAAGRDKDLEDLQLLASFRAELLQYAPQQRIDDRRRP